MCTNLHARLEMCSSDIAVKYDTSVTIGIFLRLVGVGNIFVAVHNDVRVCVSPDERTILKMIVD